MLKVNEQKLLLEHAMLLDKRESNLEEIRAQALQYAAQRGYDEEKRAKFIAYIEELEGNGLDEREQAKLDLLESYIEEIEDPIIEAPQSVAEEVCEHIEAANAELGVVNNI